MVLRLTLLEQTILASAVVLVVEAAAVQIMDAQQARAVVLAAVAVGFSPVLVALGALADIALLAAQVALLEGWGAQEGPLPA
jgi:hypothetical protein